MPWERLLLTRVHLSDPHEEGLPMFTLSNRFLAGALVSAAAVSMLASCGGDSGANADNCKGAQVKLGALGSSSDALLFIAEKKGYFKSQGLNVQTVKFDSAAKMITPLGSGQIEIGAGAPSAGFYNAVSRGIGLRIVADKAKITKGYDFLPVLVRKKLLDSGQVKSVADLKGRKVAEPAKGTATASTIAAVLKSADLGYNSVDHEYLAFPAQVAAFRNGSIDAAATIEPFATVAVNSGVAAPLFDSTKVYDNQQISVLVYSSDFSEERPHVAQCFMNAYVKAANYYDDAVKDGSWKSARGKEVASIVAKAIGISPELFRQTNPSFVSKDASVNKASLERDYTFFKDQGLLEGAKDPDFSKLVDMRFVNAAAHSTGR